ncbi:hypothetical protein [Nocardia brasiliensis]|uniref:hypothetical protein n=1 Tax=Nocardia brasiliensis TaxID=37326 RepID=UPI001893AA59|nr:hypothetical protein [Nocardia brasiliensis]MBF6125541.1 hypothetical protein [Nocardia brasiliensis]
MTQIPSVATAAAVTPEMVVRVRAGELRRCTRTRQFDRIAAQHQFTTAVEFDCYVDALLVHAGIDYDRLHQIEETRRRTQHQRSRLAALGPRIRLWSAATMTRFTVCAHDGRVLWRDEFTDPEAIRTAADAAETAARQAIRLAEHARTYAGVYVARLVLVVSRSRGVPCARLHQVAEAAGLALELSTATTGNPAAVQREDRGAVDWSTSDLNALLESGRASA